MIYAKSEKSCVCFGSEVVKVRCVVVGERRKKKRKRGEKKKKY